LTVGDRAFQISGQNDCRQHDFKFGIVNSIVQPGILYGIGVGPGDPELITVKGLGILKRVPIVAFPAGVQGKPGMAQQMVAQWLNSSQVQLALSFPYVQDNDILTQAWQAAAERVWQYLELGQDVAFVSEGDVS
jgi:precorrin-2/cobalt-factor-2 C20-methyltransferase